MNARPVIVDGTLQSDGITVRLEQKLALPPGRVTISVQAIDTRAGPTMLETLDRIHADHLKRGRTPMTEEDMTVEIAGTHASDDEEEGAGSRSGPDHPRRLHVGHKRITQIPFPGNSGDTPTGALQFQDDWPGLFIRGDCAIFLSFSIKKLAERLADNKDPIIGACLRRLMEYAEIIERDVIVSGEGAAPPL